MKPRVYIASPISQGDLLHNVRQADTAFFALLRAGFAPWNPVLSVYAGGAVRERVRLQPDGLIEEQVVAVADRLPGGTTHADWMGVDIPWVSVADAVLRLPGKSVGADAEVRAATARGIPVFHSVSDVIQWGVSRA